MKSRSVLILLVASVFFISVPGFAEIKDVGFENKHTLQFGIRSDDDDYDIYSTRTSCIVDYNISQMDRIIKIIPFFEYQSNLDTNTWWRKELGAEIGTSFFNEWFYYGAIFQHVWQKEENYPIEFLEETTEWKSRLEITPPIKWGVFKDKVTLTLFDEYTYDFTRGQPTFNEVGVTFEWKILDWLKVPIGWSHLDRVHDFDNDMMEFSVLFSF